MASEQVLDVAVRRHVFVIDPALVPRLGFGLGDFMSVCLTHMDRAAR